APHRAARAREENLSVAPAAAPLHGAPTEGPFAVFEDVLARSLLEIVIGVQHRRVRQDGALLGPHRGARARESEEGERERRVEPWIPRERRRDHQKYVPRPPV